MITTKRNTLIQDSEEKFKKLKNIKERHLNCFKEYENIISNSEYKVMSKNSPMLGVFISDENLIKYFSKKGMSLTSDAKKRDFLYYFDKKSRLLLSIMYNGNGGNRVLRWCFFYYYDDHTEIIQYSPEDGIIRQIATIEYQDGVLDAFLESSDLSLGMSGYIEYLFNLKPNRVVKKIYGAYTESISELARLH